MDIERKQIKDFRIALKDMEPMVKNPEFLRTGRSIPNFKLRPREAWANWLLCVVLQHVHGDKITFAEDSSGDGILINTDRREWVMTEHVSALDVPSKKVRSQGEDLVVEAIEQKVRRGVDYARGKMLVVFHEAVGVWYPNRVGRRIADTHHFIAVFGIGLLVGNDDGYSYSVSQFEKFHSQTWKVKINSDFTDWDVSQIQ